MTDVILALNAGSSSIKFSLFVVFLPEDARLLGGLRQHLRRAFVGDAGLTARRRVETLPAEQVAYREDLEFGVLAPWRFVKPR